MLGPESLFPMPSWVARTAPSHRAAWCHWLSCLFFWRTAPLYPHCYCFFPASWAPALRHLCHPQVTLLSPGHHLLWEPPTLQWSRLQANLLYLCFSGSTWCWVCPQPAHLALHNLSAHTRWTGRTAVWVRQGVASIHWRQREEAGSGGWVLHGELTETLVDGRDLPCLWGCKLAQPLWRAIW